jgi:hypothetical protein
MSQSIIKYRRYIVIFLLPLFFITACEYEERKSYYVTHETTVTFPDSLKTGKPVEVFSPEIVFNLEKSDKKEKTTREVKSITLYGNARVTLKKLTVNIAEPENGTFQVMDSLSIYFFQDTLSTKEIVTVEPQHLKTAKELDLSTSFKNVADYTLDDTYRLKFRLILGEKLPEDYTTDVLLKLFVEENLGHLEENVLF